MGAGKLRITACGRSKAGAGFIVSLPSRLTFLVEEGTLNRGTTGLLRTLHHGVPELR